MAANPVSSPGVPYSDLDFWYLFDDDSIAFLQDWNTGGIPSLNLADFPSLTQSGFEANDQMLIDPVGSRALYSTASVPQVAPFEFRGETSHGRQGILEPLYSTASVPQVAPFEFRGETSHGRQGILEPLYSTASVPQVGPFEFRGETSHGRQGILEPLYSTASVPQVGPSEFRGETSYGRQGILEPLFSTASVPQVGPFEFHGETSHGRQGILEPLYSTASVPQVAPFEFRGETSHGRQGILEPLYSTASVPQVGPFEFRGETSHGQAILEPLYSTASVPQVGPSEFRGETSYGRQGILEPLFSTASVPQVGPFEFHGQTSHGRQGILEPLYSTASASEFRGETSYGRQGILEPLYSTASVPQVGPFEFRGETSHGRQGILEPDNSGFANPVPLPIWSAPPPVPNCSFCLRLRDIAHVKGNHMTRLEIHGTIGLISHAILENQVFSGVWITQSQYNIDFSKKSMEVVKEYLVAYCEGRKREGYRMQEDPFVTFYEALCVGLVKGDHDNLDPDDFLQLSLENPGENQVNQDEVRRRTHAEQRERTANMTLEDLTGYFHLPIEDAARELEVCISVIKNICRANGIERWPYRKVNSIQKKIDSRKEILNRSNNAEERANAQNELESLEQELASVYDV